MSWFDSHCHLDDPRLDGGAGLWQRCCQQGIERLLIPAVEPASWGRTRALAHSAAGLYWAAGLHPWWVAEAAITPAQLAQELAVALADPRCVAVGECGLDGAIATDMALQETYLRAQLAVAAASAKPLILHAHRAHTFLQPLLKQYHLPAGGVIHGFSGSAELARSYWRMGFCLGIGATITYPRAAKTRAAVKALPLAALLLETDAPDMPLAGHQGQPNSPLQLPAIGACLAQLRGESPDDIAQQTSANACRLFQLPVPA